eukprot:3445581-Alexandrium_andersonii.AAC.1
MHLFGAVISTGPGKSFRFAEKPEDRRWLGRLSWPIAGREDAKLEVPRSWRDLGGHMDSTAA